MDTIDITIDVSSPPFRGLNETVTGEVAPPTSVEIKAGETAILKSATGGGGGGEEEPHPLRKHKLQIAIGSNEDLFVTSPQICIRPARAHSLGFAGAIGTAPRLREQQRWNLNQGYVPR
jgi:hypothetical protein